MEILIDSVTEADSRPEWETPELITERVAEITQMGPNLGGADFDSGS